MSLLRIHASLIDPPQHCQWLLTGDDGAAISGEGPLAGLPRRAGRVQLILPAAQVLITRARLPPAAKRDAGSVLAFVVEEQTAGEPDGNHVSWLGSTGDHDALAVVNKAGLARWRDALGAIGISDYEVHSETLLLPWNKDEWSLAWNGHEGFVRTGEFDGAATDCGDPSAPPLSLHLLVEEASANETRPASIALYASAAAAVPDVEAWTREIGIAVRFAGIWNWQTAPADAGIRLSQQRQRWRAFSGMSVRLRPAAAILGAALAIHGLALAIEWASLANQQRALRAQMELRFRTVFPDAVAVADPVLQMRRKLAEARHAAGQTDSGDFLPMIEHVAAAAKELPAGAVRVVSYESGRMALDLSAIDDASLGRFVASLLQAGLVVDTPPVPTRAAGAPVVISVRSP